MPPIDRTDTAWMLICTALVMLMTPGLSLFYGGLVREKNALNTIMQSFFLLGLVSVLWVAGGYSLAFGPSIGGLVGGLDWALLAGVGATPHPVYAPTIPHALFMAFQMMFAVITPALISGAFAERKRFSAFAAFSVLWSLLVYAPVAHWVWAEGGWLRDLGALDFAGGTVIHVASGVSALVCARALGRRGTTSPPAPHNPTMTLLGAALLWFGWFGFNAGSALSPGEVAVTAFVTTHVAAATGTVGWTLAAWIRRRRVSVLGAAAGAVAGLVAITPSAGFVTPSAALAIGLVGGIGCELVVESVMRGRVDDALDVFGVHGAGGILGALMTGVFATRAVNPAGADGLLEGSAALLGAQAIAVAVVCAYAAASTWLILKLISPVVQLRVSPDEEELGLDRALHGERAYTLEIPR
jgi:Amt family ammonium transporter